MDFIKFINEGTIVPNPNYKKGAKEGLTPFLVYKVIILKMLKALLMQLKEL